MATANVVTTYVENGCTCLEIAVDEGAKDSYGRTAMSVYTGRVPVDAAFQALTPAGKKAALVAAAKAIRDAQVTPVAAAPAITGTVTV